MHLARERGGKKKEDQENKLLVADAGQRLDRRVNTSLKGLYKLVGSRMIQCDGKRGSMYTTQQFLAAAARERLTNQRSCASVVCIDVSEGGGDGAREEKKEATEKRVQRACAAAVL